ncbi:MAG: asparagine--tRNA ligase [Phycisphaerales bacterium]
MTWLKIKDALTADPGTAVTIKGWVRTKRDSKADGGLSFIAVHDGTCFDTIQAVARNDLSNYDEIAKLTTGSSVEITGKLVESQGKGQSVEIQASEVTIIGWVEDADTYPVAGKRHSFEYLREVAHLRTRTNTFGAVARVRHALAKSVHDYMDELDYYWVHTPIITGSDCEGAGEMFRVSTLDLANVPKTEEGAVDFSKDFFGKESHLTVSGQLNVETYACSLSRVYTFGPTFRAENSNTSRHLAEFWMIEPETAFADLHDNIELASGMLRRCAADLLTRREDDLKFFDERIEKGIIDRLKMIADAPVKTITYTDAIKIVQESGEKFDYEVKWGSDMQSEHERYLTEKHFKQPVAVINYPKDIKAFYMRLNDEGTDGAPGRTVAAVDILVPGVCELIGGSQREERLDILDRRIDEMKLCKDDYWWYRDLRKYGTVPHAGYGLGFERLIQFCTGMQNIRDVIPFPRAPRQAEF